MGPRRHGGAAAPRRSERLLRLGRPLRRGRWFELRLSASTSGACELHQSITMITILITGVGGPLGQAILKAARLSEIPCRIVGTDRFRLSVGLGWVEKPCVIPDASR